MERILAVFQWIGANEAVLSGLAATIVILGVLFTPVGRGLRTLLRRPGPPVRGSAAPHGAAVPDPPAVGERPSIAVLPFANLSGDPAHEYLADGLSEDILLGLSRVKQFFVIARNSTFTYKGKAVDAQQVSRELGVRYVLEGSVRVVPGPTAGTSGARVRVGVQLVDAATRTTAWAERFDRKLGEILQVDDEITQAIVSALQPALRGAEADRARRASPEDLTAWALANRGWVAVQRDLGSPEAAREAIEACEEALRRDPDYAFAHAVLGHARSLLAGKGAGSSVEQAEAAMQRALQLGADDPQVHYCYAALLGNLGRTAQGVRAWERALELDPNSAGARAGLGIARIYLRQPDYALRSIEEALRLSPRDPLTYHWLANRALALALLGRWEEALEVARDSVQRNGSQVGYAVLAAALARQGQDEAAREAFAELRRRVPALSPDAFSRLARAIAPDEERARDLADALARAAGPEAGAVPGLP